MKRTSDKTLSERATFELAKEALYRVAPDLSVLSEKLASLEVSLRKVSTDEKALTALQEIADYRTLTDMFVRDSRFLREEAAANQRAASAIFQLMEKGLNNPEASLSDRHQDPIMRVFRSQEQLQSKLHQLVAIADGEENPLMRSVARNAEDCLSFIQGKMLQTLHENHALERLTALRDVLQKRGEPFFAGTVLGFGLSLMAIGGFLGMNTRFTPNAGKVVPTIADIGGVGLTIGGALLRRKNKAQEAEAGLQSPRTR